MRFEGVGDMVKNLDKAINRMDRAATQGVKETAHEITEQYRDGVHVDTGELRDSIDEQYPDTHTGVTFATAPHAEIHEYGTRRTPANPSLTRAVENNRDKLPKRIKEDFNR